MALRLRRLFPVLLLAAAGCSLFGPDAPADDVAADSASFSVDSLLASIIPPGASPADTAPPSVESVRGDDTGPGVPPLAAEAAQAVDTMAFLLSRLDSILVGQQTLSARLDSLAARSRAAQSALASSAAGEETAGQPAEGQPADTTPGDRLPTQVLGEAGQSVQSFGIASVLSIFVIILFNFLIRGSVWLLDALAERQPRRRLFFKRLVPITRIVLWIFAAYLIIRVIFQINAQGIFAAAAAIGVAVGFAAQDLLKNLFGGLILVFDQPFQVGDKVRVGETYGEVVSIGLRSTRIVTPDDNLVSVPNSQVVDQQVANANAGELNCQVVTDLFLPGWVDEESAKRIAFQAASSSKYVYLNKPIVVLVADVFKETFLTRVRVKAYVLDPRFEFLFQSDITERARAGFREAGLLRVDHTQTYLVEQALSRGARTRPDVAAAHAEVADSASSDGGASSADGGASAADGGASAADGGASAADGGSDSVDDGVDEEGGTR